jgi:hypothetical protein
LVQGKLFLLPVLSKLEGQWGRVFAKHIHNDVAIFWGMALWTDVLLKRLFTYGLHSAISQKIARFLTTAVRTKNRAYTYGVHIVSCMWWDSGAIYPPWCEGRLADHVYHHQQQNSPLWAIALLTWCFQIASSFCLFGALRPTPNMEDQVPVFMSSSDRTAQLYSKAPDSLFTTYHDLRGCGRGFLIYLHMVKIWH